MLKGQAKEDFEKWLRRTELINEFTLLPWIKDKNIGIQFYSLPFSMQHGVLVDWFDSVGIYISISHNEVNRKYYYDISTKPMSNDITTYSIYTRTQARQKAIEKANEIYNNR